MPTVKAIGVTIPVNDDGIDDPIWVAMAGYVQCRDDSIDDAGFHNRIDNVYAGAVYGDGSDPEAFMRSIKRGHHSLLEHVSITYRVTDISRSCSHQIVRHRIGVAISQQSMRYVKVSSSREQSLVVPKSVDDAGAGAYENIVSLCHGLYQALIESGVPIEDARMALPIGTKTRIVMTFNLRALMHFFALRSTNPSLAEDKQHAQWEIREVADGMLDIAREYFPLVFDEKMRRYWL